MLRARIVTPDVHHELLSVLVHRVRLLSVDQVARTWFGAHVDGWRAAKRCLRRLTEMGTLETQQVLAQPVSFPIERPVVSWQPGSSDPDSHAVSYRLKSRWSEAPKPTTVCFATNRGGFMLGGSCGPPKHPAQIAHDLLLAEVYLFIRDRHPELAKAWMGEADYEDESRGEKLPDAMIGRSADPADVLMVIESGGAYDAPRVQAFHEFCKRKRFSYQIW